MTTPSFGIKAAPLMPEPDDYIENGIIYCGKCHSPKQLLLTAPPMSGALVPIPCACIKEQRDREDAAKAARAHRETVARLKRQAFACAPMRTWTFEHDNGNCPQMYLARHYVEHWPEMAEKNTGYLLWGGVGTGKSFFAGCIANALLEQEVPIRMTNFAEVINDLNATFEKNEYISHLCHYPLLILDDFGMERGTEYGLEQVYNVIDTRYRIQKPLIVTTNLSLHDLKHPRDSAHARIFDRLLAMCVPIMFTGSSMRKDAAKAKLADIADNAAFTQ